MADVTRALLGATFFNFGAFATFVRHLDFGLGAAATFVRWLFQVSQSTIFRSFRIAWPRGSHGSASNPAENTVEEETAVDPQLTFQSKAHLLRGGMEKAAFYALRQWKQRELKKARGVF